MHTSFTRYLFIPACAAVLLTAHSAKAQNELLQVTVNTTSLESASESPFYLDFQFNNGSTTSNVDNSVVLSDFNFGAGGSATAGTAGTNITGGGSINGSLTSPTLTISDGESNGVNEFYQAFTPGNLLTFDVSVPRTGQPGVTPEDFLFAIQDTSDDNLATTDPSGNNDLVTAILPIAGSNGSLALDAYQSTGGAEFVGDTTHPDEDGVVATAVPEPGAFASFGLGIAALLGFARRSRRTRA